MSVTVRADYENNAELFWDTVREKHPAIAKKLKADTDVVLTEEEWEIVQAVEGFEDGPSYAPTALIEVQE
jgi:sulfur relay (sulfurtransferase) DsrC/TusE family protein